MDEIKVNEFKDRLLEQKKSLNELSESSQDASETVELDQTRQGRLSRMDALQGQAMSIAASNRRVLELKRIDKALKRISEGEFGYCQECGDEIAESRLNIDPSANYCISCAEKKEK